MNNAARVMSGSIPHVVTDIIIWMLPIPTLCKMRLPRREKVVLITLMSLGLMYVRNVLLCRGKCLPGLQADILF